MERSSDLQIPQGGSQGTLHLHGLTPVPAGASLTHSIGSYCMLGMVLDTGFSRLSPGRGDLKDREIEIRTRRVLRCS